MWLVDFDIPWISLAVLVSAAKLPNTTVARFITDGMDETTRPEVPSDFVILHPYD